MIGLYQTAQLLQQIAKLIVLQALDIDSNFLVLCLKGLMNLCEAFVRLVRCLPDLLNTVVLGCILIAQFEVGTSLY